MEFNHKNLKVHKVHPNGTITDEEEKETQFKIGLDNLIKLANRGLDLVENLVILNPTISMDFVQLLLMVLSSFI